MCTFVASIFISFSLMGQVINNLKEVYPHIGLVIIPLLLGYIVMMFASFLWEKYEHLMSHVFISIMPMRILIRAICPNKIDEESENEKLRMKITPIFPKTGEEFKETLRKIELIKNTLCVAAEAGAVRVSRKELKGKMTTEFVRTWVEEDPIVYQKNGDFVAVLAQFGSFSREKKAIEFIKKIDIAKHI